MVVRRTLKEVCKRGEKRRWKIVQLRTGISGTDLDLWLSWGSGAILCRSDVRREIHIFTLERILNTKQREGNSEEWERRYARE